MPAPYELGFTTISVTAVTPLVEFVAGAGKPASILEFGFVHSVSAGSGSTGFIGRPGNTPAGGTAITAGAPAGAPPGGGGSAGGVILSGWTTPPTAPAAGNIRAEPRWGAAYGGKVFAWLPGEMIVDPTRSGSFLLWNLNITTVMNCWMKWIE